MALRFTNSMDGKLRTDVRVTIRLSADDLTEIKKVAREEETPWRKWLTEQCESGMWRAIIARQDAKGGY